MKRQKKKNMYIALLALVLMITIGYAALSANLKINGTSTIDSVTWDVHFENAEATANSNVTPTTAPSAPAASKLKEISYEVTFDTPGQIYEFNVDVKNGGTIDAMIDSITSKIKIGTGEEALLTDANLPSYMAYSVTYEDGSEILPNHELKKNTSETLKVHVEFKRNITNEELAAASGKTIALKLELNYKQADGNEIAVHPVATGNYVVSSTKMNIGSTIPSGVNVHSAATAGNEEAAINAAMADWASILQTPGATRPFYLKHVLNSNDEIEESYVEFVVTEEMATSNSGMTAGKYTLRGGVDESSESETPIYNANKAVLLSAFGSSYCAGVSSGFYCGVSGLRANAYSDGNVGADGDDDYYCSVNDGGSSYCEEDDS